MSDGNPEMPPQFSCEAGGRGCKSRMYAAGRSFSGTQRP